jgi:hypothetical protein
MTVHIQSDKAARGPHDIVWDAPGSVASVDDHKIAREILLQPGFTEVVPAAHGKHEAPDPAPAAEDEGDDAEAKKTTRARKTPVAE